MNQRLSQWALRRFLFLKRAAGNLDTGIRRLAGCAAIALGLITQALGATGNDAAPILVYHRFGPAVTDGMTVRTDAFAAQLEFLKENGYAVVPLRQIVDGLKDGAAHDSTRKIAITMDDGHLSVYTEILPLVLRYRIPVTLFIYPSAISNASYALTWQQLDELRRTGLFDIQSHTYWHPNFRQEKRKLSPEAYRDFVRMQLVKPRKVLAQRLGVDADLLAWPFGIYDDELLAAAAEAGYAAAFTIERRHPNASDRPLALPRYMMTDAVGMHEFRRILKSNPLPH